MFLLCILLTSAMPTASLLALARDLLHPERNRKWDHAKPATTPGLSGTGAFPPDLAGRLHIVNHSLRDVLDQLIPLRHGSPPFPFIIQ